MYNYGKVEVDDVESEVTHIVKQTLDRGLSQYGVLNFRIPADDERFTDLTRIYMRVELEVTKGNGESLGDEDIVCLDQGGMHSLFSSCDVSFNGEVVSSMSQYPYSTLLCRLLGATERIREDVWSSLDGSWGVYMDKDDLSTLAPALFYMQNRASRKYNRVHFYGRIHSDVLMSSRQYLPPGVSLGVEMRRKNAAFSLIAPSGDFEVGILSASIFVPRLRLSDTITHMAMSSVEGEVANLTFNRLETRMANIAAAEPGWQWRNIVNYGPLPNRIYFALVPQKAVYGTISRASSYFDTLALSSFNVKLDGRDILVDPMKMDFRYTDTGTIDIENSDVKDGYMSIVNVLNYVANQVEPVRITNSRFCMGGTIYAVELGRCGEKGGSVGVLDVELTFGEGGCKEEACAFVFTEKTAHIPIKIRS